MKKTLRSLLNGTLWLAGITEQQRYEYIRVHEDVEVKNKEHRGESKSHSQYGNPTLARILQGGECSKKAQFYVTFKGPSGDVTMDNPQVFEAFQVGDKGRIIYDQAYLITTDFVYPDFDQRREVNRSRVCYADKVEGLTKLVGSNEIPISL